MKKQEYRQAVNYYTQQINQTNISIAMIKAEYIQANAPYPLKSIVKVLHSRKDTPEELVIASYNIGEKLELIPVFETKEGKAVFTSRPVILELVK